MFKYELETLRSPLSAGESWERKDRRKVLITLDSETGQKVYLGLIRPPVDQAEADRLSLKLDDLLVTSDDLFLDPLTAHQLGQRLMQAAEFAGLTEEQIREAEF